MRREGAVAVHIGAGEHSAAKNTIYVSICEEACQAAITLLRAGASSLEAATAATVVLEDANETNAGLGSNITEQGTVEMDAGVMDGSSLMFGAVGAVSGVKNPILVAKLLLQQQCQGLLPLGRVPPGFLVGEGARKWALAHGIKSATDESLISQKSRKLYHHYKRKLDAFDHMTSLKRVKFTEDAVASNGHHSCDDGVTDTVGVVVMDQLGHVTSTVSSGGIALKQSGRVGQAACFGCGCWAEGSLGVSTSGCGEHLIRTLLARECAHGMKDIGSSPPLHCLLEVTKKKFLDSNFLYGVTQKMVGVVCLQGDVDSGHGEFMWCHTTPTMGIGFQTTSQCKPFGKISRLPETMKSSSAATLFGESISFSMIPSKERVDAS